MHYIFKRSNPLYLQSKYGDKVSFGRIRCIVFLNYGEASKLKSYFLNYGVAGGEGGGLMGTEWHFTHSCLHLTYAHTVDLSSQLIHILTVDLSWHSWLILTVDTYAQSWLIITLDFCSHLTYVRSWHLLLQSYAWSSTVDFSYGYMLQQSEGRTYAWHYSQHHCLQLTRAYSWRVENSFKACCSSDC